MRRKKEKSSEISRQGYCHLITLLIKGMNRYYRDQNLLFTTESTDRMYKVFQEISKNFDKFWHLKPYEKYIYIYK